jgi:hypothetical protein
MMEHGEIPLCGPLMVHQTEQAPGGSSDAF